ncbi:DUF927 domain-containing protein (plasmid) [Citrobacter freundii]|uniref:DUF927 domain-containing protein n=3 Tax=Citrobacter TaxID=544 RepID=UPI00032FEFE4|nr:DUF927 domain-containing protein [Enterobacter asburiae]EOQ44615.1 hypothetical protein WC7_05014 [Citrobacter sp. KTE151]
MADIIATTQDNVTPIKKAECPYIVFSDNGVLLRITKTVKDKTIETLTPVCASPLRVIGWAEQKNSQYRVIQLGGFRPRKILLPMKDIGTPSGWSLLMGFGAQPTQQKGLRPWLAEYLQSSIAYDENGNIAGELPEWQIVNNPGWLNGAFVMPDCTLLSSDKTERRIIVDLKSSAEGCDTSTAGTLESWKKEVGALVKGNDHLLLALGVALAGPMLGVCNVDGFGVHFFGESSAGKTTAGYLHSSVFGNPSERQLSWNATPLALCIAMAANNDLSVFIDELKMLKASYADSAIYSIFSQRSRLQGHKDGGLRETYSWRNTVLSTGELTIDAQCRALTGHGVDAGVLVRMLDIRFEPPKNLHGAADGAAFSDRIKSAAMDNHGVFGRVWLQLLTNRPSETRGFYQKSLLRWASVCGSSQGQYQRVASKFALIETALLMNSKAKNIPVAPAEITAALERIYAVWAEDFNGGNDASRESFAVIERAENMLTQIGHFLPWGATESGKGYGIPSELWGYIKKTDDQTEYYILREAFREHIAVTMDASRAAKLLEEAGMLIPCFNGKKRYEWRLRPVTGMQTPGYRLIMPDNDQQD